MWFNVDKSGLAAILERRGKAFALFELVQNAWDAGASHVTISLSAVEGQAAAKLVVEDDSPEGFVDLAEAFTLFGKSRRAADPGKRGRFCLGEKLVLAMCREATIISTGGGVQFNESGRRRLSERRETGTRFEATIRLRRDELAEIEAAAMRLIPPANVVTDYNGQTIARPKPLKVFEAKLPTEFADADGNLKRTTRTTMVEVFAGDDGGEILEMGIPVCAADWPWRLNVHQKIPLGMERDSVTDAFRRALQVAVTNAMHETLTEDQATSTWATEALSDARIIPDAARSLVKQRFGDRAVVAVPGDPMANATAEAMGCAVVHGGSLPADAWANIRKNEIIPSSSAAFPTPTPIPRPTANSQVCPLCKQSVRS